MSIFSDIFAAGGASAERHIEDVEAVLQSLGLDPTANRLPQESGHGWAVRRGSAVIFIYLYEENERGFLKIVAPIVVVPEGETGALLRHCLELNLSMVSAALALNRNVLCVVSERGIADLSRVETEDLVKRVAYYADELDNQLVEKFGGKLWSEANA